jgi:hypothetical protein
MSPRSIVFLLALAAISTAAPAQAPPDQGFPYSVGFAATCEDNDFFLVLDIADYTYSRLTVDVRRIESAPNSAGEAILATGLPTPDDRIRTELVVPDPAIPPGGIGLYEVVLTTEWGETLPPFSGHASCVDAPLMLGHLRSDYEFEACETGSLYACPFVELNYGELYQYAGSFQVLEIRGHIQQFETRDDCWVLVTDIVPLERTDCEPPTPATPLTWGALKSLYR